MAAFRIILSLMVLLDFWWWYTADRQLRAMGRRWGWARGVVGAWVLIQVGLQMLRFLPARQSRAVIDVVPMFLVAGQYLWHLGLLPVVVLAPFVVRGVRALGRVVVRAKAERPAEERVATPLTRRQVLASVAAVAVPPAVVAAGSVAAIRQYGHYRIRRMTLHLPTLPGELDGLTIAHLSDFHVGRFVTPAMVRDVVNTTNEMKPDLVFVTGDLIDYALSDLPPALDELTRLRPTAGWRQGVSMCIGNHDVIDSGPEFIRQVRQAGFSLITNAVRTIQVRDQLMQVAGIGWHRPDDMTEAAVRYAANGLDRTADGGFPILLAHHPHAFDEAARLNIPLTLSGHTHGGQVMATEKFGFGSIMFRYWSGLYAKPNGSQLVVSNGIGNWFPLRVNAPAELIHLTLRRGAAG